MPGRSRLNRRSSRIPPIRRRAARDLRIGGGHGSCRGVLVVKGKKTPLPYRVEVTDLFAAPKPYGWQIYRRGGTSPVLQSLVGYARATDAWTAGGSALEHIFRDRRKA